ncbi:MAG TPA: class I SAM-dependent methyltransferase [Solirubrobacteraceae bacterium]|nr:class I SAM-dependent methyltransferase [Solirubrobacteraceae bacterium]
MRVGVRYEGLLERLGGLANQVPVPIGLSMFGMPIARSVQTAQRLGVFTRLAERPWRSRELAAELGVREQGLRRLLDVLVATGVLRLGRDGRYSMPRRVRTWLDPGSPHYLGDFLADSHHYWEWWGGLEDLVREGRSVELHDRGPDDPYWRSYITGQYQLARLSSDAVARVVALAPDARSLLDVAGAHGEFAMALCRRHRQLHAMIVDLPGSARIGREIVAAEGMADRVAYVEGDMFEADLGGLHDGALVFNILHHLTPDRARALLERVAGVLRPGAPLCVVDLFDRPAGQPPDSGAYLGLFFHLTSGADTYSRAETAQWMQACGFGTVRARTLPQLPGLAILRAERRAS